MPKISYIIPHRGRDYLLLWHLDALNRQFYTDFEVIVIVDDNMQDVDYDFARVYNNNIESGGYNYPLKFHFIGQHGPATARNAGVIQSKSDIVMFVGSDCLPSRDLIGNHYLAHHMNIPDIVQGYTPWHSDSHTPFMRFLDHTGMQANWAAVKDEDGNWIRNMSAAFCLTTNYSISKKLYTSLGGFDQTFTGAAWEDIEFGFRLSKFGYPATFAPEAVNYHYHRYEIPNWLDRCFMEGEHRMEMCAIHPEMGWNMLEPEYLKQSKELQAAEVMAETVAASFPDTEKLWQLYSDASKVFSFLGIQKGIDSGFPGLQALYHIEHPHECIEVLAGTAAIKLGRYSYALHCGEWMISQRPGHWYAHAFLAEIKRAVGDRDGALFSARKSIDILPGNEWATKIVEELAN